jgi:predicted regulator of Ras-like GTPase activity (Roadblock/LC7/MglB family)
MMYVLKDEESKTDLENLAILSRVGMKVASSVSSELDADATSASSTALIDFGLRLNQATDHGALTEIILHNASGYSILMAINDELIVFGGLSAVYRIGYYLGYLRELARKLNKIISGEEATEMVLSLEPSELEKFEQKREEDASIIKKPSLEQDKAALDDLLGFLDDWEKEGEDFEELEVSNESNIVSIPPSIGLGIENEVKHSVESETPLVEEKMVSQTPSQFKVYGDEVPPIPLDDYTPMEIEEEGFSEKVTPTEIVAPEETSTLREISASKTLPPLDSLPSLEELGPPDFDSESDATEYDTEFVLEEESEALGSVLKELGWSEDED